VPTELAEAPRARSGSPWATPTPSHSAPPTSWPAA